MTAPPLLVDTSAWVESLRRDGDADVRRAVQAALVDGRARVCAMVLVELWNGARSGPDRALVQEIADEVAVLATSDAVWELASALARASRAQGVTVPATDLVVAACARTHKAELLHRDAHFEALAGITP